MAYGYQGFLKKKIDLAPLGVERGADRAGYFCTPQGASIIGWAGVDGIHYCFIRGFGEMVFAVSPANAAPDYVHPLARNFDDFLRLLLACGDAAALEQAWMWDRRQFETFLRENPPTQAQAAVLSELSGRLKLEPMADPWQYIKGVQASFDFSKITDTRDAGCSGMGGGAQARACAWKVYFEGNFRGRSGRDHAGREIPVGRRFQWAGRSWVVPSLYACGRGLVIDFCMQVEPERFRAFMKRWDLLAGDEAHSRFTPEQQMEIERDNPFCLDLRPKAVLNGKELPSSHGCSEIYYPEDGEDEGEARRVVEHYGLDPASGWLIWRASFPWAAKRRPAMEKLSVILRQERVPMPGPHFRTAAAGDTFDFIHPPSGEKYTLTVQEVRREELPESCFASAPGQEFPRNYLVLCYTITPELSEKAVTVTDCAGGDRPRRRPSGPAVPGNAAAIGIIGGADGPTALIFGGQGQNNNIRTACSALYFEPAEDVEWRMIFYEIPAEEGTVELI